MPAYGRHVEHDPRSWGFHAARAAALTSIRHTHHGPILDQGQLGSCTANACAQLLNTDPFHPGRLLDERDAVAIYSWATHHDNIPGSWPTNDTGSSGLAVAKAARHLGLISGYHHAFGLQHALEALTVGPVITGIPWHTNMETPDPDGQLHPGGGIAGGHEVVVDELDVENQRIWILNSWGDGWGVAGRAWMPWTMFGDLLAQQGDVTVLVQSG